MRILRTLALPVVLTLFGLFVSLLCIEIGYRIVVWSSSQPPRWSDRPRYYFQAGKAETLQDYQYPDEKPQNRFRVGVIGDSYSFAPYMQFTDAFPKVLERMLNLNQGEPQAEVINHGVPAYSTSHEVKTAAKALEQGSDLLLLQITLNDPEIKPITPIGITHFNTWGPLQLTGWKATVVRYWSSLGFVIQRLHNESTRRRYIEYFINLFEKPDTWANFERSTKEIVKRAKEKNVPLVAVVFPLFGVPLDSEYPFHRCHEKVGTLLKSLDVPLLDLFSLYEGIPIHRLQVIPEEDRHPNEIAHRMAAERIYDWLEGLGIIPEPLRITAKYKKRTQIIKEVPFEG